MEEFSGVSPERLEEARSISNRELNLRVLSWRSRSLPFRALLSLDLEFSAQAGDGRLTFSPEFVRQEDSLSLLEIVPKLGIGYPVTDIVVCDPGEAQQLNLERLGFTRSSQALSYERIEGAVSHGDDIPDHKKIVYSLRRKSPAIYLRREPGGQPISELAIVEAGVLSAIEEKVGDWTLAPYSFSWSYAGYAFLAYKKLA